MSSAFGPLELGALTLRAGGGLQIGDALQGAVGQARQLAQAAPLGVLAVDAPDPFLHRARRVRRQFGGRRRPTVVEAGSSVAKLPTELADASLIVDRVPRFLGLGARLLLERRCSLRLGNVWRVGRPWAKRPKRAELDASLGVQLLDLRLHDSDLLPARRRHLVRARGVTPRGQWGVVRTAGADAGCSGRRRAALAAQAGKQPTPIVDAP